MVQRGERAERNGDRQGKSERHRAEPQGGGQPLEDQWHRGRMMSEGIAKVAADGSAQEVEILNGRRTIETHLVPEAVHLRL